MLSSALAMVERADARSHRDDPPVFRGGQALVPEVPRKRERTTMSKERGPTPAERATGALPRRIVLTVPALPG